MKSANEIRENILKGLRATLLRPNMYYMCELDMESGLRGMIGELAWIDELDFGENWSIKDQLIDDGFYYPKNYVAGVKGIFQNY